MTSFGYLSEAAAIGRDYWFKPVRSTDLAAADKLIERGLAARPDRADGETFWDDFIDVFGTNAEQAAALLGVSPDLVARWPDRVRKALGRVREGEVPKGKKGKAVMLPTGMAGLE